MTKAIRDSIFNESIRLLFHDAKWENRAEVAKKLGFLQDSRAVNLMCRALNKESNYIVINHIIESLGRIGNPKATLDLIKKLKEEIKESMDKYRIKIIIESLININDKRALSIIGYFLTLEENDLKDLAKEAFNKILPNWRDSIKKEMKIKSLKEIFDIKL